MDLNHQEGMTPIVEDQIEELFKYHSWTQEQKERGDKVRAAIAAAYTVIIDVVPACADRTSALRLLRTARMESNHAITFGGKS